MNADGNCEEQMTKIGDKFVRVNSMLPAVSAAFSVSAIICTNYGYNGWGGVLSILSCPLFIVSANSSRSEKVNIFVFSSEKNIFKSSTEQFNRISTIPFVFLFSYFVRKF